LGEGFAARVAASLLNAIGLPELVANSTEEYERLALALARNPQRLASVRTALAERRMIAPLFDSEGFVRHLEDGYRKAYTRHLSGGGPENIEAV
jgi:predicted O-linked N-acetylglucosamine transferase (SPINDLY family)